MTLPQVLELLAADLCNEYRHMHFYLYHATSLVGLHAEEYKELFAEEAKNEMEHVKQFSNLLWGFNFEPRPHVVLDLVLFTEVRPALQYACNMEADVVKNYATRINQCAELLEPDRTWITVFLEEQLMHSRQDVDRFRRLLLDP
jgi:bacterioferritin (cytochrome b1)